MADCVILIGLPASGKSSFFRARFASTHDHVSKDRLRNTRHPERRQQELIAGALSHGRSVVVDNTNASAAVRAPLVALARAHGASTSAYFFETDVGDALRRNRARQGPDQVPDVAIHTIRKRLEPPAAAEGFDQIFRVTLNEEAGTFDVVPYSR
jgi:predicted kinase